MNRYDIAIIGSGPCGYVAGIRAAQLGLKVCLFERGKIGGVCLNKGCIPTKVLCHSAEFLYNTRRAAEFGIDIPSTPVLNLQKIQERKDNIIKRLCAGIETLLKARHIEIIRNSAEVIDDKSIRFGSEIVESEYILIATGSLPAGLPNISFDGRHILSSDDILDLKEIPEHLIIIGGGVIGCEFGSLFSIFGSKVTIIEALEHLLPNEDEEISKKIEQIFRKRGIRIYTMTKVEAIRYHDENIDVLLSDGTTIQGNKVLLAVGRKPNITCINAGLEIEYAKGWIKVDNFFRTNIKNIYAGGDVKGGTFLAHIASLEGICAVEHMAGYESKIDYNAIPNCIFTFPEIASTGLSERRAIEKGIAYSQRKFPFSGNGKAHILGETDGFIKIIVDSKSDVILGAQIIGPHATELIAELSLCVQVGITSERLARIIHSHPTLSEAIREVSEAVHNKAIHLL